MFVAVSVLCAGMSSPALAVSPNNYGMAGLWEYPTAEMPGDGKGWISYTDYLPYRSGAVDMGLFPWLELNIHITEYESAKAKENAGLCDGYGYYKDKAMDLKLLLSSGGGYMPSLAVGALDMMGTEIRKAYFAAATWRYQNVALTLGYATDIFGGFYGGVSWEPADWLEIKAEYGQFDYASEKVAGAVIHPEEAKEKYNIGAVIKSPWGLNGSISYQRGEELCLGMSYAYDFTKPVFDGSRKAKEKEPLMATWDSCDETAVISAFQAELGKKGFGLRNVVVLASDRKVHVAFENIGYSSQAEGTARVILLASAMLPWDTSVFSCSPMVRGNPVSRVELTGEQLSLIRLKKFTPYDIAKSSFTWAPKTKYGTFSDEEWTVMAGPGESIKNGMMEVRVALAYEPRIDRRIDRDFYMDRIDVDYIGRFRTSFGLEAYLKIRQPIQNNIDIWWEPEANDVTRIWQGVLSFVYKLDSNVWLLSELGWLDQDYFGANIWGRYYIKNSPFWLGGRLAYTKERDAFSFAGIPDYKLYFYNWTPFYIEQNGENSWNMSYFFEAGYHDVTYNADLMARYGKFADGDKGYRLDAVRRWDALSIGFYYTDTDRKTTEKGFTDAGMNFNLPITFWYDGHTSNAYWAQEFTLLSTFRLFAGKVPGAWMTPERLIGELAPERLSQELSQIVQTLNTPKSLESELSSKSGAVYGFAEFLSGKWRRDMLEKSLEQ